MSGFTPSLDKLIEQFARLPSVGRKSAQRLAFHILEMSDKDAQTLPIQFSMRANQFTAARFAAILPTARFARYALHRQEINR
jgi:recombinational DNA repair protein RecR